MKYDINRNSTLFNIEITDPCLNLTIENRTINDLKTFAGNTRSISDLLDDSKFLSPT
jgi:hypothetical protein